MLRFSLDGGLNITETFTVDTVTGVLTVMGSPDRENRSSYAFDVIVRDDGSPSLSGRFV